MIDPYSREFRRRQKQTDFVDFQLELHFVAGALKSRETMERVYLNIDSNVLTNNHIKWIYDEAVQLYADEAVLMDEESFKNALDVEHRKRKKLMVMWKKIKLKKKKVTHASTIRALKKLKQYYDARMLSLCIEGAIGGLGKVQRGNLASLADVKETVQWYGDYLEQAEVRVDAGEALKEYGKWKKQFKKIQKDPSLIGGITTGIKEIDRQLVGLRPAEFGLVAGPSGSGKSILLMDFATHCWQVEGDVAVVTIEMPKEQYESRWFCRLSGIDYEKFRKYELDRKQWKYLDKVVERSKNNPHKFVIIDVPEGCTVSALKSELKLYMQKYDIKLVVVDYMNIMASKAGEVDMDWQNQVSLAVGLKSLARSLYVPVWTVSQVNDKDNTAFSTHIRDQLDVGLLMQPDEETDVTGVIDFSWLKTRDFRGVSFRLQSTLDKMRFSKIPEKDRHAYRKINRRKKKGLKT